MFHKTLKSALKALIMTVEIIFFLMVFVSFIFLTDYLIISQYFFWLCFEIFVVIFAICFTAYITTD